MVQTLVVTAANGKTLRSTGHVTVVRAMLGLPPPCLRGESDCAARRQPSYPRNPTSRHIFIRCSNPPLGLPLDPPPALSLQVQLPLGKLTMDHFQTLLQLVPANSFHSRDNDGELPLHIACRVGAPREILRLLVQTYAAALQTRNNNGSLPLHAACQADDPSLDAIRFVVEQDPTAVQAANNDGALPLHSLCGSRPSVQVVQYLMRLFQGALEVTTNAGDLPLMLACKASSSQSVLQVLLTESPEALIYMQEYYS